MPYIPPAPPQLLYDVRTGPQRECAVIEELAATVEELRRDLARMAARLAHVERVLDAGEERAREFSGTEHHAAVGSDGDF